MFRAGPRYGNEALRFRSQIWVTRAEQLRVLAKRWNYAKNWQRWNPTILISGKSWRTVTLALAGYTCLLDLPTKQLNICGRVQIFLSQNWPLTDQTRDCNMNWSRHISE